MQLPHAYHDGTVVEEVPVLSRASSSPVLAAPSPDALSYLPGPHLLIARGNTSIRRFGLCGPATLRAPIGVHIRVGNVARVAQVWRYGARQATGIEFEY